MNNITGRKLKEIWKIDVKYALYRETGDWYHLLKYFPAALFDKNGYIIFENEEEYKLNKSIQIAEEIHIPKGISTIPGYVKVIEDGNIQEISHEIIIKPNKIKKSPDGKIDVNRKMVTFERVIRDTKVSNWVKQLYNNHCQICGTTIELSDNVNYSEGHHILPIKNNGPDIINNLICVCPNHHIQLDYGAIKIDRKKLTIKNGHNIKDEYIKYHNENIYKKGYGT